MKRVYQSENQSLLFIVILGSLTAFGPLAIDMFYLDYLILVMILIFLHLQLSLLSPFYDWISVRKFWLAPYLILLVEKTINFLTDYFYYCEFRYYIRHKYMDYDYFTIYSRINWWCRCSHLKSHC